VPKISNNNQTNTPLVTGAAAVPNSGKLTVNIKSRTNSYYNGSASSLTSVNDTGEFDVLPFHANFITIIRDFITIDKGLTTEKKIEIKSAVLSVIGDRVDGYVGI
jgi:F0F1-type ATP synthase epsilon subunit